MNLRDVTAFAVIVACATGLTMTLGPYWFLLLLAVGLGVWLLCGLMAAAGRADRELERMRWEHTKNRGEPPRGGRDAA